MGKAVTSTRGRAPAQSAPAGAARRDRLDLMLGAAAVLVAIAVYLNTLTGVFVYDDTRQIVGNTLIQDGRYFWKAIFSDVWAFKGTAGGRVSNYWRPSFVLWLIANVRTFGLDSTFGWHAGNIALHALTTGLAFALTRRLGLSTTASAAIALLFAVHPVHVESVAWISGSPDLILAPALLGSMWFVLNTIRRPTVGNWAGAIALYVVAQGAKEVAIFYPVIVSLAVMAGSREDSPHPSDRPWVTAPWKPALLRAAPFAAIAALYLIVRASLLGPSPASVASTPTIGTELLSAPQVAAFYLRQIVFPLWIGPSYPLRPVLPANLGLMNFVVPLAVCALGAVWMLREARRSPIAALGLAIFALTLAPALHVGAFLAEQIVHDRYLYLALLGFLMIAATAVTRWVETAGMPTSHSRGRWHVLVVGVLCAVPLSIQTLRYNGAWLSELSLWSWGVRSDPTSVFNFTYLAQQLRLAAKADPARLVAARAAADRSIALADAPSNWVSPEVLWALTGRAEIAIEQRDYAVAEADLRRVLQVQGPNSRSDVAFKAFERLASCYDRQQDPARAEAVLREARARLPHKRCALTQLIAVVLYNTGRREEAVRELESVRGSVAAEYSVESRLVLLRLGILYEELNRTAEAKVALREFLDLSAGMTAKDLLDTRAMAKNALIQLGG